MCCNVCASHEVYWPPNVSEAQRKELSHLPRHIWFNGVSLRKSLVLFLQLATCNQIHCARRMFSHFLIIWLVFVLLIFSFSLCAYVRVYLCVCMVSVWCVVCVWVCSFCCWLQNIALLRVKAGTIKRIKNLYYTLAHSTLSTVGGTELCVEFVYTRAP